MEEKEKTAGINEPEKQENFVFMREEIKARPVDKRKFLRNSVFTVVAAIVFGLIATVTFVVLVPWLEERVSVKNPVEEEPVSPLVFFPEETPDEEMNPEDMIIEEQKEEIDLSQYSMIGEEEIRDIVSSVSFSFADYEKVYESLFDIANEAYRFMVTVTAVNSNTDWFNELYEGTSLPGVIVADNGTYSYILTYGASLQRAKTIMVKFCNGVQIQAEFRKADSDTDLVVLELADENMDEATKEAISVARLGSSFSSSLVGTPTIAIGSPMGTYGSINYGVITSNTERINVYDNYYKKITTDIYGSSSASGVLINSDGEVEGIVTGKFSMPDTANMISAIGITELKKTIEDLINGREIGYLGIKGSDVPGIAREQLKAPTGVYVMSVDINSPAMYAGIQSGDIITSIGDAEFTSFIDLANYLRYDAQEGSVPITAYRLAQGEYKKVVLTVNMKKR